MGTKTTRRDFIKKATISSIGLAMGNTAFSAKSYANIIGANDRINMAVMGTNGRGAGMARNFARQKNVVVSYVCDVEDKALAKGLAAVEAVGGKPKVEKDIRRLLEKKEMDI